MAGEAVALTCSHCRATASGTIAEAVGAFSRTQDMEYRIAGLTRLSGWSALRRIVNPAGIGGGPTRTVARLADATLDEIARGDGPNAAAARAVLGAG
jgi:hypothetical protein